MEETEKNREAGMSNGAGGGGEADDDEESMEKFYSIIRSFRDARLRLRNRELSVNRSVGEKGKAINADKNKKRKAAVAPPLSSSDHRDDRGKLSPKTESSSRSWVPSFEWQDFKGLVDLESLNRQFPSPPLDAPAPCLEARIRNGGHTTAEREGDEQQDAADGLDLKLAL